MTTSSDTADALLARVRAVCFDFAGTEEKRSHGAPFFHVRGRGFVIFAHDHHGDGRCAAWCKATPDDQRRLTRANPDVYFVPPYVGVKGWVGVRLDLDASDFDALAMIVEEAWRSVVPRSLAHAVPTAPPHDAPVLPTTDPAVVAAARAWLTALAATLPGSSLEASPGQLSLRVRKRPYAYLFDNVHRDGVVAVGFRSDEAEALVTDAPKRFLRAPYLDPRVWVSMRVDGKKVAWKDLARRVTASHRSLTVK